MTSTPASLIPLSSSSPATDSPTTPQLNGLPQAGGSSSVDLESEKEMNPTREKPNLHTLPPELLRWTSSFLDSSSALALATVHTSTQTAAERQLWTKLNVSLPKHFGQHPWDESLPYPPTFHPSLTRQVGLRARLQGILDVLRADPSRSKLVKDLYLEVAGHSAVEMIGLLASISEQLETLSLCQREEDLPNSKRSVKYPDQSYPQLFYDLLVDRDFRLDNLKTLTLKHGDHFYLLNLQRILSRCPNLVSLTIKGGHKGHPSPYVHALPPLPRLESLNVVGTRVEPFELIDDLLSQSSALSHLRIKDSGHIGMDRGNQPNRIPSSMPLEQITARLRACRTLKSIHWKFNALSLGEVVRLDETLEGPFASVERIWTKSHIYNASMARLEFVDIPVLPNLKELFILESTYVEKEGHRRARRLQTASHTAPDGFLPRLLDNIRNAPQLEKIYLPDFTGSSKSFKNPRQIGKGQAGVLIRSYTHPMYGELVVVRLHTKSKEHYEDLSTVFPPPPEPATAELSNPYGVDLSLVPSHYRDQNPPVVQNHLMSLGVPSLRARYANVPRWIFQQLVTAHVGPIGANAIILYNYGPTSAHPITFGPNGPNTSPPAAPIVPVPTSSHAPVAGVAVAAQAGSNGRHTAANTPAGESESPACPAAAQSDQAVALSASTGPPQANHTPRTDRASSSLAIPHPPPADDASANRTTGLPDQPADDSISAAQSTASAASEESTNASEAIPTQPSRSCSPPPISSIGTHWHQVDEHHTLPAVHNPHAIAVTAASSLQGPNAPQNQPTGPAQGPISGVAQSATPSPGTSNSTVVGTTSAVGSAPQQPVAPASSLPPPPTSGCIACVINHGRRVHPRPVHPIYNASFEEKANHYFSVLPTWELNPDPARFPQKFSYMLTPRDSLPANPTVLWNNHCARLYYTPPDYPFPPFVPPDRSYDVQKPVCRSFVEWEWHWEEYAMFNGRILSTEAVEAWRAASGLPHDWRAPGRGLEMNDAAWKVLLEWEEQRKAAWVVRRAQMGERRKQERQEEMAKLGREVKGKSRAPPPLSPPPAPSPSLEDSPLVSPAALPPPGPLILGARNKRDDTAPSDDLDDEGSRERKRSRHGSVVVPELGEPGPSRYATPDTTMREDSP